MNEKIIKGFVAEIEKSSPLKLKVKGHRYNPPRPVHFYGSKRNYIPDIEVTFANNKRSFYIFESEVKEDDISQLLFKWILFSSEAKKMSGKFYLVINKADAKYCEEVIRDKQLDVELVVL